MKKQIFRNIIYHTIYSQLINNTLTIYSISIIHTPEQIVRVNKKVALMKTLISFKKATFYAPSY